MSFLMTILQKAGLVVSEASNVAPGQHPKPADVKIEKRTISIKDLLGPQAAVVSGPKGFKATPEDVFAAAKLEAPADGWTAEKLRELAQKPIYREMSAENRQKAILAELATASANPESIVADAVRKDEALDAYERFLTQKLEQTRREAAEKKRKLEDELEKLDAMVKQTAADFEAWKAAKRRKEEDLAEALAPLLQDGKISRS